MGTDTADRDDADALGVEGGDITYAALLDRHAAEEPITDEMVRRACLRMEPAQRWPFAAGEGDDEAGIDGRAGTPGRSLSRLFRVRR